MPTMHTEPVHVVKRPLITEKSTHEAAAHNRYAFEVDVHARKETIRAATTASNCSSPGHHAA
jgi:ribosomal protein L23